MIKPDNIEAKDYLSTSADTVAVFIFLTTPHSFTESIMNFFSAVTKGAAWSSAYDTPLGFSQVYSIAGGFITGCPSTNPTLPVKAFPAASIKETGYKAGETVTLDFKTTGATEYCEAMFIIYYPNLRFSDDNR